jgi:hypothetical protein
MLSYSERSKIETADGFAISSYCLADAMIKAGEG